MVEFWQDNNTRVWLYAPKFVPEPTTRMERAQDLAEHDGVKYAGKLVDGMKYNVRSCTNGEHYTVVISRNIQRRSCDCKDHSWRKHDCKHIYAACMYLLYEQLWPLQFREMADGVRNAFYQLARILKEKNS